MSGVPWEAEQGELPQAPILSLCPCCSGSLRDGGLHEHWAPWWALEGDMEEMVFSRDWRGKEGKCNWKQRS